MGTMMKHRQVVLLICGLMADPSPIILLVYECWIDDGQKSAGKSLIEAIFRETGLPVPKDPLHNQWINYYDHSEGLIKDTSPVYIPSRMYWFKYMKAKVSCQIQHGDTNVPECTMSIYWPDESVTKNISSICYRICQHQLVRSMYMNSIRWEDLPEPHVFTISKNTESIKIISCKLPTETLSHLLQQINGCSALRVLDLSYVTIKGCLYSFLPDPHPGLPKLEVLNLRGTVLNKEDLQHLLSITYKLPKLHKLDPLGKTLTRCLTSFVQYLHPGLLELRELDLEDTKLIKEDLQHLSHITQYNKLPSLQCLNLSDNTLTGCLTSFLPDPHPGLLELRELDLENTKLNKEDLQHLSCITQSNKSPKLEILDLSRNTLTGCLTSFLPDPHPGLPELEKLNLQCTALNKEDLQHLTRLIQTHKLPGLKDLDLQGNRLSEMETDFEHLIEACVNHHQTELWLWLWGNGLSGSFVKKWEQRCAGMKIELAF